MAAQEVALKIKLNGNGGDFCAICSKNGLLWGGHGTAKRHVDLLNEHAHLDLYVGCPDPLRNLSITSLRGVPGSIRSLTRARVAKHWGLPNPRAFEERFKDMAWAKIKSIGGSVSFGKQRIPVRSREDLHLMVVNYDGQGTYKPNTNWAIPFHALPLGEPSGQPNEPGSASSGPQGPGMELDLPNIPEPFGTWWPVLAILDNTEGRLRWLSLSGTQVVCVCVYQWTWPEPGAWTITVVPLRPSRL